MTETTMVSARLEDHLVAKLDRMAAARSDDKGTPFTRSAMLANLIERASDARSTDPNDWSVKLRAQIAAAEATGCTHERSTISPVTTVRTCVCGAVQAGFGPWRLVTD